MTLPQYLKIQEFERVFQGGTIGYMAPELLGLEGDNPQSLFQGELRRCKFFEEPSRMQMSTFSLMATLACIHVIVCVSQSRQSFLSWCSFCMIVCITSL